MRWESILNNSPEDHIFVNVAFKDVAEVRDVVVKNLGTFVTMLKKKDTKMLIYPWYYEKYVGKI